MKRLLLLILFSIIFTSCTKGINAETELTQKEQEFKVYLSETAIDKMTSEIQDPNNSGKGYRIDYSYSANG